MPPKSKPASRSKSRGRPKATAPKQNRSKSAKPKSTPRKKSKTTSKYYDPYDDNTDTTLINQPATRTSRSKSTKNRKRAESKYAPDNTQAVSLYSGTVTDRLNSLFSSSSAPSIQRVNSRPVSPIALNINKIPVESLFGARSGTTSPVNMFNNAPRSQSPVNLFANTSEQTPSKSQQIDSLFSTPAPTQHTSASTNVEQLFKNTNQPPIFDDGARSRPTSPVASTATSQQPIFQSESGRQSPTNINSLFA